MVEGLGVLGIGFGGLVVWGFGFRLPRFRGFGVSP